MSKSDNNIHIWQWLNLNRYEKAINYYDKVLAIKPTNVTLLYLKANILPYLGKYDDAIASYDRILAIEPDNLDALFNKGFDLGQLGRFDEAVAVCDKALQ